MRRVTFSLTWRRYLRYQMLRILLNRGTSTGGGRLVERVRFLRAGFVTQPSGGPGIVPSGTTTGARGAPLKRDWRRGQRLRPPLCVPVPL
jgi:hypothetical protein